jgi:hypothetical protein
MSKSTSPYCCNNTTTQQRVSSIVRSQLQTTAKTRSYYWFLPEYYLVQGLLTINVPDKTYTAVGENICVQTFVRLYMLAWIHYKSPSTTMSWKCRINVQELKWVAHVRQVCLFVLSTAYTVFKRQSLSAESNGYSSGKETFILLRQLFPKFWSGNTFWFSKYLLNTKVLWSAVYQISQSKEIC